MAIAEHGCCFHLIISAWILMYAWSHGPAGRSTYDQNSASLQRQPDFLHLFSSLCFYKIIVK